MSSVAVLGVAANSVADGFGTVDKIFNVSGVIGSESNDTMVGGSVTTSSRARAATIRSMAASDSISWSISIRSMALRSISQTGAASDDQRQPGHGHVRHISDVYGSFSNDTFIGNNGDNILFGRDGDDRFAVSGSFVTITQQDVFNKLFSIEAIDLTGKGNNSVTLNALDVLQSIGYGVMRIIGDSTDTVTSQGQGWAPAGTTTIDGQLNNIYHATVQVRPSLWRSRPMCIS